MGKVWIPVQPATVALRGARLGSGHTSALRLDGVGPQGQEQRQTPRLPHLAPESTRPARVIQ